MCGLVKTHVQQAATLGTRSAELVDYETLGAHRRDNIQLMRANREASIIGPALKSNDKLLKDHGPEPRRH